MVRTLTNLKQDTNASPPQDIINSVKLDNNIQSTSPHQSNATLTHETDLLMSTLSSTSSSSSSDIVAFCPQTSNSSNLSTYICIITDLTDPSNTCKRHVINLSSSLSIESLIEEAANFFSYDPSSFNLMWKVNNEEKKLNLEQIHTRKRDLKLSDLNLKPNAKNLFEIHETQNGPPKRLKMNKPNDEDDQDNNNESPMLEPTTILEKLNNSMKYRRNAGVNFVDNDFCQDTNQLEYGPSNLGCELTLPSAQNSNMGLYNYSSSNLESSPFSNYDDTTVGYVGLINQAMTCYLNSLLQTLFMTPEFRNAIYRWKYTCESNDNDNELDSARNNIPYQLQRLFLNLQTSTKKSIQTHDLTKSFGWNSDDAFQQHDVQELCRVMFDALERTFKDTPQKNLINELYQGKIKDYVKCLECNIESARINVFLDISLCIRRFGSDKTYESVEAALDAFVEPEILDEGNKYFCDKCNKMCKAHKGLKFESFPYIISLQLNRFDFDYNTMSRFKLSNTVTFPEILDVKKYLLSDEEKNEDEQTESKITNENDSTKYELFSIMIHSGNATGGHYYAYIKCFETDQWYNFNDERVNKLDKHDIKKAFGTSNSMYSSTTAYMLFYRQKNSERNEKFIKVEEFSDYLKSSLEKEKTSQVEAEKLKELMENSCKIKVIVPEINSDINSNNNNENKSDEAKNKILCDESRIKHDDILINNSQTCKLIENINKTKKEKTVSIHKDLTLDLAKLEIIKEFNLTDYVNTSNKKCRILKYDTYNDLIEQSYMNENSTTVFEALGFTKYPYNICWYLEILPCDEEFIEYNSNDFNVKLVNLNIRTFETNDMFSLRLKGESTVNELRKRMALKLNCDENLIRMALEKPHSMYNYVYLNKNLNETLQSQQFCRVNKVFLEYEDEADLNKKFDQSKFCYALDAIINMLQTVVYLPSEEDCEIFLRKTKRHSIYTQNQKNILRNQQQLEQDYCDGGDIIPSKLIIEENTTDSVNYDIISSVQSVSSKVEAENEKSKFVDRLHSNTESFLLTNGTTMVPDVSDDVSMISDVIIGSGLVEEPSSINIEDTSSKMSIQMDESSQLNWAEKLKLTNQTTKSSELNMIEDHFKLNNKNSNLPQSHHQAYSKTGKSSKVVEWFDHNLNDMETSLDEGIGSSGSLSTNNAKNSPINSEFLKSVPEKIINNRIVVSETSFIGFDVLDTKSNFPINDDFKINNTDQSCDDFEDDETNLGDVVDRCSDDVADLDVNVDDDEINNIDDDFIDTAARRRDMDDDQQHESQKNFYEYEINDKDLDEDYTNEFKQTKDNSRNKLFNTKNEQNDPLDNLNLNNHDLANNEQQSSILYWSQHSNIPSKLNEDLNEKIHQHNNNTSNTKANDSDWDEESSILTYPKKSGLDYVNNNSEFDPLPNYEQAIQDKPRSFSNADSFIERSSENRFIKSNLIVNNDLGTRTLEIKMDKRIDLNDFKTHISSFLNLSNENFRVFRMCPNDFECELTSCENQFSYLTQNTKFVIKLGPPLKYGEYVVPIYKLSKEKGTMSYLCDFMIVHGMSVFNHKELLRDDLKDECNLDVPVEKIRLRKKNAKKPGILFLNNEVFGKDVFVNSMTELCMEIIEEPEKKLNKSQTCVYLRHWKPDEHELSDLQEIVIEGNSYEQLIETISSISGIDIQDLEVLKCNRDFPFKSPILDLHKDMAWKENFIHLEKIEDGVCFYFRNKTLKLGPISEEKRREMAKEDNLNFRPSFTTTSRKETGIKIHVNN